MKAFLRLNIIVSVMTSLMSYEEQIQFEKHRETE